MDLEEELLALRYQRSEMLGKNVMENSPDEMARLVFGGQQGLARQNATHGDNSQGQGARCGYRLPGFEGRIGDFLSQVFLGTQGSATGQQFCQRHTNGDVCSFFFCGMDNVGD